MASEAYIKALENVAEAARCIRHWHCAMDGEGMVVSSEKVRLLWESLSALDLVEK